MMNFTRGALAPKADLRDYKVAAATTELPKRFSIPFLPDVKNQKNVGSCVAHATSSILEYFNKMETGENIPLSTDFIYGMQGIIFERLDSGMFLRDACKIVKDYGDCFKSTISTNTEQPKCTEKLKEKLNDEIYKEANILKIASYARCKNDNAIKHALLNYGPILASVKWYDDFKVDNKNVIHMNTNTNYGYHAIMIYGWDENGWLCQNSWGKTWNGTGRFIYPYSSPLAETWSFVDAANSDVIVPANNSILNIFYRIINRIINFLKGRV